MDILLRPWGHLHYRAQGPASGLPVIFANSLGTDLRMWDAVTALLPDYRCIGFDQRGHGLSATPDADWTIEDIADDVLALMDALNLPRALIAGCSMGGMVAQAFGLSHPDRALGLILSNTAAKIGTAEVWQARIDAIAAGGIGSIVESILQRWFAPDFLASPACLAWRTMLLRNDPAGYMATCRAIANADFRADLPRLSLPTLMIGGSADPGTSPALMAETAALIPGATLTILQGSGHLPAIDAPDAVATLITQFAKGLT